jgi:hypothetical protein
MADLFLPVKIGLGEYMGRFKQSFAVTHNDTNAVQEFAARPPTQASIVFAPSRMADAIEEVLSAWRKNTNENGKAQSTAFLPVMAIAVARDYTPASPSQGMMLGDAIDIKITNYPDERNLKLELIRGQLRVQVVVIAADDSTAKSLIARFCHFVRRYDNRGFDAVYPLAGVNEAWFNTWDSQDLYPSAVTIAQTNLAIQKVDLMLNIAIPMVYGAASGQPNSGIGTGTPSDPFGLPVVTQINVWQSNMPNKVLV